MVSSTADSENPAESRCVRSVAVAFSPYTEMLTPNHALPRIPQPVCQRQVLHGKGAVTDHQFPCYETVVTTATCRAVL